MRFISLLLFLVTAAVFAETPSTPQHAPPNLKAAKKSSAHMPDDPFGKKQSKGTLSKTKSTAKAKAQRPPDPLEKNQSKRAMTKSATKANSKAKMPPDPIDKNKNMK